jgi:hypothetical protein
MAATAVTITDVAVDELGNPIPFAVVSARLVQGAANGGTNLAGAQAFASPGVKAVHTLAETGVPTGGSFTAQYATTGIAVGTVTISATSTVAQAQSAFTAAGIAATITGTTLPAGSLTVTFNTVGPVAQPTIVSSGLTGGTTPAGTTASATTGAAVGSFTMSVGATDDSGTANLTSEGLVLYDFSVVGALSREKYQQFVGPVPHATTPTTLSALRALADTMAE